MRACVCIVYMAVGSAVPHLHNERTTRRRIGIVPRITRDLMSLLMHKNASSYGVRRTHRSWPKIHLHRRTIYFDYYRFTGYACLPISNLRNSFTTHTHTLPDDLHEKRENYGLK